MPALDWRTALKGLAGLVLAVVVWWAASPVYQHVLAAAAEKVIRVLEIPPMTRLKAIWRRPNNR